jgi:hypothetical protein
LAAFRGGVRLRWPLLTAAGSCSSLRRRKVRRGRRGRMKTVGTSSSPGEWIVAASALTPAWITTIWRLAQTGGHRRGKRGRGGGCALDWSGGGAEGEKGGDGGARSLLKRRGGEAEEGGWSGPGRRHAARRWGRGPATTRAAGACVGDARTGEDGVLTRGPGHCVGF